ncbi:MAG: hypothetical protein AAGA85_06885 [Bacteroidota bacterium]
MEINKIDQLFREKTEAHEAQPSAKAWEQIAARTQQNNGAPFLWKVAAAITIVASGLLLYWQQGEPYMQYVTVDHPVPPQNESGLEVYDFEVPAAMVAVQTATPILATPLKAHSSAPPEAATTSTAEVAMMEVPTIELSTRSALVAVEGPHLPSVVESVDTEPLKDTDDPVVSIKYYADASTSEGKENKKKFSTLLAKAQTFSPGEFLADLRAAKDDLLRSKKMN